MARSQPGSTRMSLLSSATHCVVVCAAARFTAGENPRFFGWARTSTHGYEAASSSSEPSRDPLSTSSVRTSDAG